jgi:hypothetical protein
MSEVVMCYFLLVCLLALGVAEFCLVFEMLKEDICSVCEKIFCWTLLLVDALCSIAVIVCIIVLTKGLTRGTL